MNYTDLVTAIQDYTSNKEPSFVTHIPDFVKICEERIYNSVTLPAIRKNSTGGITAHNKYLLLPPDWLATFSLAVVNTPTGGQEFLLNKDVEFIRESFPEPAAEGLPLYYAQFDVNTLILGPTPDVNYTAEIHYYSYPTSIVTANTTWLGDNFENVLLYGSIREAYVYMKGEADIIQQYEAKYQEGLGLLKRLSDGLNRRDAYRSGQTRTPVP